MKWTNKRPKQAELQLDPTRRSPDLQSSTRAEFDAILAREQAGEFRIQSWSVGRTPAAWTFKVVWK